MKPSNLRHVFEFKVLSVQRSFVTRFCRLEEMYHVLASCALRERENECVCVFIR